MVIRIPRKQVTCSEPSTVWGCCAIALRCTRCTCCTSRSAGNTASGRMESGGVSGGATRLTPNRHSHSVEAPRPHRLPRRHAHRLGGGGARRRRASRVAVRRDAEQWATAAAGAGAGCAEAGSAGTAGLPSWACRQQRRLDRMRRQTRRRAEAPRVTPRVEKSVVDASAPVATVRPMYCTIGWATSGES